MYSTSITNATACFAFHQVEPAARRVADGRWRHPTAAAAGLHLPVFPHFHRQIRQNLGVEIEMSHLIELFS
jgi:hypothetical protein